MKRKTSSLDTTRILPFVFVLIGIGMSVFVLYATYLAFAGGTNTETQAAFHCIPRPICMDNADKPCIPPKALANRYCPGINPSISPRPSVAVSPRANPSLVPFPTGLKGSPMLSQKACPEKIVCLQSASAIYVNGKCQCPPTLETQ